MIENDRLTYIHTTPTDTSVEEAFMGNTGSDTNQVDRHPQDATFFPGEPGRMSDAHKRQYLNFMAAIAGEEPVRVGLRENRNAISIITGVYESARTGLPVRLDSPTEKAATR